jgi:predicted dienelactone hydrolase
VYHAALANEGGSYRGERVRAVFAMAPALGPAFLPDSLERIDIPMVIVAGAADAIMPVGSSARSYAAHIPQADLTIFPGDVGHYVFVEDCAQAGRATLPALCIDAPEVDRHTIHVERRRTSPRCSLLAIRDSAPSPSRRHRIDGEPHGRCPIQRRAMGGERKLDAASE